MLVGVDHGLDPVADLQLLQAGDYLVVSLFPYMAHGGMPQAAEGMVGSFTVK